MILITGLLRLLAPYDCLSCGAEGKLLCGWCKQYEIPAVPPRCYGCRSSSRDFATCTKCRRNSRLANVWVASEYEGVSKLLIRKLKFERAMSAADEIAELMAASLPYLSPETIVTFAPTATSRRRQRGYDQSELIAKRLARLLGLRCYALLLRQGHSRQVGATRAERKRQLGNAFRARKLDSIKDSNILLVDDIVTTGATLEAAAQTLKSAGAKRISAAVFAQKL